MASRSDTTFNKFPDRTKYFPKRDVLTSAIDSIFDDQDLCYRAGVMVLSASFFPAGTNSATYADLITFPGVLMKHYMLSASGGTVACTPYVKAWANSLTDFTVQLTHSGTGTPTSTVSVTATETTKTWHEMSAINIQGAEDTVTVSTLIVPPNFTLAARRDAGTAADYVFIQGLMIVADKI